MCLASQARCFSRVRSSQVLFSLVEHCPPHVERRSSLVKTVPLLHRRPRSHHHCAAQQPCAWFHCEKHPHMCTHTHTHIFESLCHIVTLKVFLLQHFLSLSLARSHTLLITHSLSQALSSFSALILTPELLLCPHRNPTTPQQPTKSQVSASWRDEQPRDEWKPDTHLVGVDDVMSPMEKARSMLFSPDAVVSFHQACYFPCMHISNYYWCMCAFNRLL